MSKEYVAYKTEVLNNKIDIAVNKTTLGTQCKNLLDVRNYASKYTAGVTASPNGVDGLTFSGTANNTFYLAWNDKAFSLKKGDYILSYAGDITSDKPNNIFLRVRKSDNTIICDLPLSQTSKSFSLNVDDELYFIAVYTNVTANVQGTIKPMIRYAEITDDTYEPYKESVDTRLTKNKSDTAINRTTLGTQCKNLLKNTAVTKTVNGVTFTVNSDGSVTVNGTNTSSGTTYIQLCGLVDYGDGKLIASIGQNITDVYMAIYDSDWNWIGTGSAGTISFENSSKKRLVRLVVKPGVTINNVTVYPMIRYADITDDTYEPYKESVDDRIDKNASDIAVNKSALGYKRKNLLSYPKSIVKGGITFTCDENGYMTSSNTTSDSRQWTSANAQYSMYLEAGTYYFSSFAETVCTNSDGRAYILTDTQTQIVGVSTRETHVEKMFTLTESTTIYVIAKVYDGKVAFMIREADITDDTYEPYKDSIDERLVKIQNKIGDIESVLSSIVEVS